MLRTLVFLCGFVSATAWADLTVEGSHSPGVYGGTDRFKLYLKHGQMRIDQVTTAMINGQAGDSVDASILIRFEGTPAGVLLLDHQSRTVEVAAHLPAGAAPDPSGTSAVITRREESQVLAGFHSWRYDYTFNGPIDPSTLPGLQLSPQMRAMMQLEFAVTGTSWLVPDMPGQQELAAFFTRMAANGVTLGELAGPMGSLLSPSLSAGLTGLLADLSREGFPMNVTSQAQVMSTAGGQMAIMVDSTLQGLGIPTRFVTETAVDSLNTTEVSSSLFYQSGLPAGYQLIGGM